MNSEKFKSLLITIEFKSTLPPLPRFSSATKFSHLESDSKTMLLRDNPLLSDELARRLIEASGVP
jgi:hypothetical protein